MPTPTRTTVSGLPDLRAALGSIPAKLRYRALRNALAAGARVVRDEARRAAPRLSAEAAKRAPYRTPGTLRRAISVRTSKRDRAAGDVGVFVNVRPAKRGQRGAKSKTDPYYWQWLEFGRRGRAAVKARLRAGRLRARRGRRAVGRIEPIGFLQGAAKALPQALKVFVAKIGPQIQKLNGGKDVQL